MNVLVDSSAVLALLNRRDRWHHAAVATIQSLADKRAALVMTNFLVAETHALLLAGLGPELAREWLLDFDWNLIRISALEERLAREIIAHYRDKDFSYTDATSFVVVRQYGLAAFAYDRHFTQFGITVLGR